MAGLPAAAAPVAQSKAPVQAPVAADPLSMALRQEAGGAIRRFYASRDFRPLWATNGRIGRAAATLVGYIETARFDGLNPKSYDVQRLNQALARARSGDPREVARAEVALSKAFARYVRDQRKSRARMIYADRRLKPKSPKAEAVLRAAAFPKDFDDYVAGMGWMSDNYIVLRRLAAIAEKQGASPAEVARLRLNMDRARLLPSPWTHHVVVDSSSGRLWYYGAGKQAGVMRVVVGTRETPTPMLAGYLQWAILNPYWNVPTYLARHSIAPKVLAGRSLASMKIEALSDWSASPRKLPAGAVDWQAVARGDQEVRLRELPGPHNSMGKVKFLFPNDEGIYLHDTNQRDLLKKEDRHFSNGCIRLEKADALGRWLMQKPLRAPSKAPEQAVPLPVQVPVYLTYITPITSDRRLAFRDDVYGLDQRRN